MKVSRSRASRRLAVAASLLAGCATTYGAQTTHVIVRSTMAPAELYVVSRQEWAQNGYDKMYADSAAMSRHLKTTTFPYKAQVTCVQQEFIIRSGDKWVRYEYPAEVGVEGDITIDGPGK